MRSTAAGLNSRKREADSTPVTSPSKSAPFTAHRHRGRLLYVEDISELLAARKSSWWIRHNFAPENKLKIGRNCAWWEAEAIAWLDAQREGL